MYSLCVHVSIWSFSRSRLWTMREWLSTGNRASTGYSTTAAAATATAPRITCPSEFAPHRTSSTATTGGSRAVASPSARSLWFSPSASSFLFSLFCISPGTKVSRTVLWLFSDHRILCFVSVLGLRGVHISSCAFKLFRVSIFFHQAVGVCASLHAPWVIPSPVRSKAAHYAVGNLQAITLLAAWPQESNPRQLCREHTHQPSGLTLRVGFI